MSPTAEPAPARRDERLGRDALLVLGLAAALLLPGLASIDLWAPDEPRYAQIAEEMRRMPRGAVDWVVLRLNDTVYTQKPPLYFWSAAALGAWRGRVDETAARLPSALAGLAGVALTGILGAALLGSRRAGWIAAALLLTTPRFLYSARRAQLDVMLCGFELAALLLYWRVDSHAVAGREPPRGAVAGLHAAIGLAVLTKGPVGALPWLVILVHRASEGRLRGLGAVFPAWGIALAAGPALLWLAAATALTPAGWIDDAVLHNLVARFFSGTDHVRPFWYYGLHLPLDALPWTPLVLAGAVSLWRRPGPAAGPDRRAARLLGAWAGVFVLFFSLSAGKRGLYMVPLLPGLAILGAVPVAEWIRTGWRPRGVSAGGVVLLAAISGAGAWLAAGAPGWTGPPRPDVLPAGTAWSIAAIGAAGAAALWTAGARGTPRATILATVVGVAALEAVALHGVLPAIDPEKSPRPIARAAARATQTHERVGVFRHATFAGGLEYYGGRPVVVLETREDVDDFVASGGRIVVVRERDRSDLAPAGAQRVLDTARSGRRRLRVVELVPDGSAGPTRRPESGDMDRNQPIPGQ